MKDEEGMNHFQCGKKIGKGNITRKISGKQKILQMIKIWEWLRRGCMKNKLCLTTNFIKGKFDKFQKKVPASSRIKHTKQT